LHALVEWQRLLLACLLRAKPRPGEIVHHCRRDGSCCAGSTDRARLAHAQERLSEGIFKVLLRKRPSKMSTNKWNKLLPGFDFFFYGMAPHNLLALLVEDTGQRV
jgi:hypothetical protein